MKSPSAKRGPKPKSPSRELDKIIIRVPDGMREQIQSVAAINGRSANEELVLLLGRAYRPEEIISKYILDIADLVKSFPDDQQKDLWRSIIQKIEAASLSARS